jgi:hypothetical protein
MTEETKVVVSPDDEANNAPIVEEGEVEVEKENRPVNGMLVKIQLENGETMNVDKDRNVTTNIKYVKIVGFNGNDNAKTPLSPISFETFWKNPSLALYTYPIFSDVEGEGWFTDGQMNGFTIINIGNDEQ